MTKYIDKYEVVLSDYQYEDSKLCKCARYTIKELYGIGGIIFKSHLIVDIYYYLDDAVAYVEYDFGMSDEVSIHKQYNYLYNYTNDNPECDPIKSAFSVVKFDLMHAFHHFNGDPNYTHRHWALYGNLKNNVTAFDFEDEEKC
jgi:hypothetical protein